MAKNRKGQSVRSFLQAQPVNGAQGRCKIVFPDHTGDSCVATYDPADAASVQQAQQTLEDFWGACIDEYGGAVQAFARPIGGSDHEIFDPRKDNIAEYENILIQQPIVGG